MAKQITEESGVHKAWYDEANSVTVETLPEFVRKLTEDFGHDYGTICHAVAAAMCAAMSAVNKSPAGGITGFQAGCIQWEVLKHAFHIEAPARLIQYRDLLYPQYADKFNTISQDTWSEVRKLAQETLSKSSGHMHAEVKAHMEGVAEGRVPFGLRVVAD